MHSGPPGKFILTLCFLLLSSLAFSQAGAEKAFLQWDRNKDGFLEREEVPEGPRGSFDRKDRNGDGKVSLEEHLGKAAPGQPTRTPALRGPEISTEGAAFTISQTWSQQPEGYDRPVWVAEPNSGSSQIPVVVFFHGNGGRAEGGLREWTRQFPDRLIVVPQGYERSWNIHGEKSTAPDVEFFKLLIAEIAKRYPKADMENVSLIGSSNGGGFIHRLLIEIDAPLFRIAVPMVASMIELQYNQGSFWYPSQGDTDDYDTKKTPVGGRRILYVHGSEDKTVPYHGGMRMGVKHVSAPDTAFAWAKAQGYSGPAIEDKDAREVGEGLFRFDYQGSGVVFLKAEGGGHSLQPHREECRAYVKAFIENQDR